MRFKIEDQYKPMQPLLLTLLGNFKLEGVLIGTERRNAVKYFERDGRLINIKYFKKPHFINKIVYQYFRKSKAERSFLHAKLLLNNNLGTPEPIAFIEERDNIGLTKSYYISEHLIPDFTLKKVLEDNRFPDRKLIIQQYTQFVVTLQDKGFEFLDNTANNFLICQTTPGKYTFYIVDLNRMRINQTLTPERRIRNFERLRADEQIISFISEELAVVLKMPSQKVITKLQTYSMQYNSRLMKRKGLKNKMKFWKK